MTSIYRGSRIPVSDVQVPDAAGHAPQPQHQSPRLVSFGQDPILRRRAAPANTLFPQTVDWILSQPVHFRPYLLSRQFPRIANQLCLTWDDPVACRAYFKDLLLDRRGNRRGFPQDILRELHQLLSRYATIAPEAAQLDDVP